jgi:hypothetical protein
MKKLSVFFGVLSIQQSLFNSIKSSSLSEYFFILLNDFLKSPVAELKSISKSLDFSMLSISFLLFKKSSSGYGVAKYSSKSFIN